ncbi:MULTISPECIES: MarR family winged helix-turn-helix transcriptional regulator [Rahnella]|jgi:DNA-binding MarR family transcriptional regulator|uniref:MarR family transcriptional regulator n=1 Tax=Rahnella victoriana TaxID=1510570 RepID=A0ABS0DMA7_9GAMM|nr:MULTISPECIES: MarR family transcriptional regulator [Rahnella]VTQ54226.1 transcriptional repressor MprA [Campylobacter jejuni]MBF7955034.1 MarR family transcriptional regulator [Rahnella victoriana]TBX37239.1 MarR family transcriptional regulator [Rahnella victoriana]TDS96678.1 DNA-binding MarR family transcriptional regulator [Rahnella sp. BIGb0236]UHM90926.1 MarR family transcriptional regulator [Rahnella victoriana]
MTTPTSAHATPAEITETLLSVIRLMRKQVDAAMSAQGLSLAREKLLTAIAHEGTCRPAELAIALQQSPRTITDAIDAMDRDGLLLRKRHPTDRRSQLLELTDAGKQALQQVRKPKQEAIDRLFDGLDLPARQQLMTALQSIESLAQRIEDQPSR